MLATLNYFLIRVATLPFRFLPYSAIRAIGNFIGIIAYHTMRSYRKRTLSNLSLAKDLALTRPQLLAVAKQSFQNLAINCLEYPKLAAEKNFHKVFECENPETAEAIYAQGKGAIFFCGHLSNWEVLFLDATLRMNGIAIGKPIKNRHLYDWILSIREKNGGRIVAPQNAIKEGLRALKKGQFIGIVGDQGMPSSGYCTPFLGRKAWTSTSPALLAYRTQCPVLFAGIHRTATGYKIRYSDPIWPNSDAPMDEEVNRIMGTLLSTLQDYIKERPGEWLWQHNRWKQQTPRNIYKRYRHDSLAVILPQDPDQFNALLPHLPTLKLIYPLDHLVLLVPETYRDIPLIENDETIYYANLSETLRDDLRFKLVFNFTDYAPIRRHYEKLAAFEVLDLLRLRALAAPYLPTNLSETLKRALCRPGSIWSPHAS